MSGILGVFTSGVLPDSAVLGRMCALLGSRGTERSAFWRGEGAALAVSRYEWELGSGFSGPVLVVEEADCVVAADATLYYGSDLRGRLRAAGVEARGDTPSHLILAAYRAWGEGCTQWLEGEFAFILWDRRERRVLCSRDFSGRRPLYYADLGDTLVVGSTLGAISEHPACSDELNLPVLAASAGMLFTAAGVETCYRSIQVVPIAGDLTWRPGAGLRLGLHWTPTPAAGAAELSFEQAADELRSLLTDAVRERMAPDDTTAIWLSGGWDSTSIFGIGQEILRGEGSGRNLLPVSMSYPVGDPGREDETIAQAADFWHVPVHWLDSETIPLFDQPVEGAAARDEPLPHMYELWNRALAAGSRSVGARVTLDGYGGDQLFQMTDIFLADLLRGGRWLALAGEWRARRALGRRYLLRFTVQPLVPVWLKDIWSTLRRSGRAQISHLERRIPSWIEADFIRRHDLIGRERAALPPSGGRSRAAAEVEWYLTIPLATHIASQLAGLALQEGVEVRSPLFDRRVVEFALARPLWERAWGKETKYLLRRSVRGLLPDEVLAPRAYRTGQTFGYSSRWMRKSYPEIFEEFFRTPLILAELGIVDPNELRRSVAEYLGGGNSQRVGLFYTFQTEWWLRSRLRPTTGGEGGLRPAPALAGVL